MSAEGLKRKAAQAALAYVEPGMVVGIGTGSTTNEFIDLLAAASVRIAGTVASSKASAARLAAHGVRVLSLEEAGRLQLYVDGADECNGALQLIKGGGGALTGEKIVAAASETFVCVIDGSKLVTTLGKFPLPVEVVPMGSSYVARELQARGGRPVLRAGYETDHGNRILDVHGLVITDPVALEGEIESIAGVVTAGLFARRPADIVLVARESGVETLQRVAAIERR